MEKKTKLSLDQQLKKVEIAEKEKEIENMERRLLNVTKGLVVDQVRILISLLEARVVEATRLPGTQPEWVNAFDQDDQIKIKAKIMRLINTF